jgi:hypothetical protein
MLRVSVLCLLVSVCLHPAVTEAASPKKGFAAVVRKDGVWRRKIIALNAKWFYSWGADKPEDLPAGIEFVPMQWGYYGNKDDKLVTHLAKVKAQQNVHTLLGYNEPDGKGQANLTVDKALEGWPYLVQTGLTLGSPAAIHADNAWMKSFMQQAEEKKYRVDFITVHWYGGANAQSFLEHLKRVYALYKRPIWVTEFCPADWSGQHPVTPQQTMDFMKVVVPAMDEMPYVQRYSWFSAAPDDKALGSGALFNKDGSLTDLGKLYASL